MGIRPPMAHLPMALRRGTRSALLMGGSQERTQRLITLDILILEDPWESVP